jgi:hypothetical protein
MFGSRVWHLDAARPGSSLAGAGLAADDGNLIGLEHRTSGVVRAWAGVLLDAHTIDHECIFWAVAAFDARSVALWTLRHTKMSELGAGVWARRTAGLVDHSVLARHVARVWCAPADVNSLGVTGLSVGGEVCAAWFAVSFTLAGAAIVDAGLVVAVYVNSGVALGEH